MLVFQLAARPWEFLGGESQNGTGLLASGPSFILGLIIGPDSREASPAGRLRPNAQIAKVGFSTNLTGNSAQYKRALICALRVGTAPEIENYLHRSIFGITWGGDDVIFGCIDGQQIFVLLQEVCQGAAVEDLPGFRYRPQKILSF